MACVVDLTVSSDSQAAVEYESDKWDSEWGDEGTLTGGDSKRRYRGLEDQCPMPTPSGTFEQPRVDTTETDSDSDSARDNSSDRCSFDITFTHVT